MAKQYNINITGSLTNTNGVLSGFSASNYATFDAFAPGATPYEIVFKFNCNDVEGDGALFFLGKDTQSKGRLSLEVAESKMYLFFAINGNGAFDIWTSTTLQNNTNYWVKIVYNGSNQYQIYLSTDGETYTLEGTASSNYYIANTNDGISYLGIYGSNTTYPFSGTIDLNESYIKVDGALWWRGAENITKIQLRHDTAANWTSVNPTLAEGEVGLELDTNKQKIGDGSTAWNSLAYTVDQVFDGTSTKGQSGIALANKFENYQPLLIAGDNIELSYSNIEWSTATQVSNLGGDPRWWRHIIYDGSKFVALGADGYISTSVDGITWTQAVQNSNLTNSGYWLGLAYNGTKFVALSYDGYLSTSTDGTTWAQAEPGDNISTVSWVRLTYGGGKFVALGEYGEISTSTDGITWTVPIEVSSLSSVSWGCICYDGTKFIALNNSGYLSTSTDGTTWTQATQVSTLADDKRWNDLFCYNGIVIAVGSLGYVSHSQDGVTWATPVQDPNLASASDIQGNVWESMAYGDGKLMVIGSNGYISTATLAEAPNVISTPVTSVYSSTGTTAVNGTAVASALSGAFSDYVTLSTDQNITGTKTFVGQKKIAFKQSSSTDKLGFTLYNNSGTEKGYLEFNPSNTVDSVPLMTLGNYASASAGLTHVGFRKYSSISGANGAYNLLAPLISDAKTPFSLTTTYTNFYLPLGFTDGTTTVTTAKTGVVNLSSILPTVPTKISDLTDDTATYPIDKADTLTNLTATVTELNYVDGVTSAIQTQLDGKLAVKPDGTHDLIDNNKINMTYMPDVILGQMLYAGTFVPSTAVAALSTNAKTILGTTSDTITLTNDTTAITGYVANEGNYYIATADGTFASISFLTGDWLLSTGSGWTKVSNTDAVTGVKGNAESTYRTGNVNITADNVLPTQTSNSGKYLTTNGTTASWATISVPTVDQTYDGTSTNAQSGAAIAGAGFLTGITSSDVTTALGYTPVDKAGDTMSANLTAPGFAVKSLTAQQETTPSSNIYDSVSFKDKNGKDMGYVGTSMSTYNGGNPFIRIQAVKYSSGTAVEWKEIGIGYNSNGDVYTSCPTPASSSNGSSIATTAWVNTKVSAAQTVQSISQVTISSGTATIALSTNTSIYKVTPTGATTITFNSSSISSLSGSAYTFELCIDMSSTAYAITLPSITWQDGETPDLSSAGMYFFAFRTLNGGTTWLGNLQGVW